MKRVAIIIVVGLIALAGSSQENKRISVAIYPIKAVGAVDKSLAASLTSLLGYELNQSSKLVVIDESMLKVVMERQAMNVSDLCDDTMCQVEIGKLVQAQKMAVGELIKMGERYILTIRLIDIQSGTLESTTKDECPCDEGQLDKLVVVASAKIRNHFSENVPIPNFQEFQASTPSPSSPSFQTTSAGSIPPSSNKATIYFYRKLQLGGSGNALDFILDDQNIGSVKVGQCIRKEVGLGDHVLDCKPHIWFPGARCRPYKFKIEEPAQYYIVNHSGATAWIFEMVSESQAKEWIKGCN